MPAAPGRCTTMRGLSASALLPPSTRTYHPTTRHRPDIRYNHSCQELVDFLNDPHPFFKTG
eukprot:6073817-Prorocentrum_lima.AAC.1